MNGISYLSLCLSTRQTQRQKKKYTTGRPHSQYNVENIIEVQMILYVENKVTSDLRD